jgi:hypothetical protein
MYAEFSAFLPLEALLLFVDVDWNEMDIPESSDPTLPRLCLHSFPTEKHLKKYFILV